MPRSWMQEPHKREVVGGQSWQNALGIAEKKEQSLVSLSMAGTSLLKPPCLPQREVKIYSTHRPGSHPERGGKSLEMIICNGFQTASFTHAFSAFEESKR